MGAVPWPTRYCIDEDGEAAEGEAEMGAYLWKLSEKAKPWNLGRSLSLSVYVCNSNFNELGFLFSLLRVWASTQAQFWNI